MTVGEQDGNGTGRDAAPSALRKKCFTNNNSALKPALRLVRLLSLSLSRVGKTAGAFAGAMHSGMHRMAGLGRDATQSVITINGTEGFLLTTYARQQAREEKGEIAVRVNFARSKWRKSARGSSAENAISALCIAFLRDSTRAKIETFLANPSIASRC